MTGVGSSPHDLGQFIVNTNKSLVALERRLTRQGGVSLATRIVEGFGIDIVGAGTSEDPLVVSSTQTDAAPPLPAVQSSVGSSSRDVTWAAGTWANVTGWTAIALTPEYDLWVDARFTSIPLSSNGYVGVGIEVYGGAVSSPSDDPITGETSAWGQSPFGFSAVQQPITGSKIIMIPGGQTTTFAPRAIRSAISGSHKVTYPILRLIPLYWAGMPGPVADPGWTLVTSFENGFYANPADPPRYTQVNGVVYLSGALFRSAATGFVTAFQLPEGMWPGTQVRWFGRDDLGLRVAVSAGPFQVACSTGATTGLGFPLAGLSFLAEA